MGTSSAALAAEEDPQGKRSGLYWPRQVQEAERGRGERAGLGVGGVEQQEQWEDPLATQPDWENELS